MARDTAGNLLKKVRNLGSPGNFSGNELVSSTDKNDLYSFRIDGRSSVELNLTAIKGGNVDLELFKLKQPKTTVLKKIGSIDYSKLTRSTINRYITSIAKSGLGGTTSESVNLNLDAGEYYIRAHQRKGNAKYSLNLLHSLDSAGESLATAHSVVINETTATYKDYVGKSDAKDIYGFTFAETRNLTVSLTGLSADANLTILDGNGNPVGSSSNAGTASETLTQRLNAGNYYLQIAPNGGSTSYNLAVDAIAISSVTPTPTPGGGTPSPTPTPAPGETLATAFTLTAPNQSGAISDTSKNKYYKYIPANNSDMSVLMSGLSADANLKLLDSNGNLLQSSAQAGAANERLNYPLTAGTTYYLHVSQATSGVSTNYSLNTVFPTDQFPDTEALTTTFTTVSSDPTKPTTLSDYAGGIQKSPGYYSEEDFFKFQITEKSQLTLVLEGLSSNLDVELYEAGAPSEKHLFSSSTGTTSEELRGNLTAGTYFIRIYPSAAGEGSNYTLKLSADSTVNFPAIARDINFGPEGAGIDNVTAVSGNTVFFSASDGSNTALWKSDGTLDGTMKINTTKSLSNLSNFVTLKGILYFTANDGINGAELWRSDGTESGTIRVTDIAPGSGSSNPSKLTVVGDALYFLAANDPNQADVKKLYRGIYNSTTQQLDVAAITNAGTFGSGNETEFVSVNGTLYYNATDNVTSKGNELYRIKNAGTGTPVAEVIDIEGGSDPSTPTDLTVVGNSLFFTATTFTEGRELRRITNGSDTVTAFNVNGNFNDSIKNDSKTGWRIANVNGTVYFAAQASNSTGEELFKIVNAENASANSQQKVAEINPDSTVGSNPLNLINFNNTLYFTAEGTADNRELWKSDGTTTTLVKEINANTSGSKGSDPGELVVMGGKLYFSATDGTSTTTNGTEGRELWVSDGTTANTKVVMDIFGSGTFTEGVFTPNNANPVNLVEAGGQLFFVANNGDTVNGVELWSL